MDSTRIIIALAGGVLVIVLVLGVSFLSQDAGLSQDAESSPAPASKVRWTACDDRIISPWSMKCGRFYPVEPGGRAFQPFVIFQYPGADRSRPPLVYIAGGPGSSMQTHSDRLQAWAYWLQGAHLERDLVIYEQPGLKPGRPAWDCRDFDRINESLLTQNLSPAEESALVGPVLRDCLEEFDQRLQRWPGFAEGAGALTSTATAAKLNRLLAALEYDQWSLWGVSYGSRVALIAAQQEPEMVHSLVLDSPYPLARGRLSEKPQLYSQALERFWQYCRDNPESCGSPAGDPEKLFWNAVERLRQTPRTVDIEGGVGRGYQLLLNDHRVLALTLFTLYDSRLYPELIDALENLAAGSESDDRALRLLVELFLRSSLDPDFNTMVFFAIECNDNPLESTETYLNAAKNYPELLSYTAGDGRASPCRLPIFDPASQLSPQAPDVPALVLGGELDPVTPARWARSLAQQMPRSHIYIAPGVSHAVLSSGACEAAVLEAFVSAPSAGAAAIANHCR